MMIRIVAAILITVCASFASAAPYWILRGQVRKTACPATEVLIWRADALLINTTLSDATVRVTAVSNRGDGAGREFIVPALQTRSFGVSAGDFSADGMWISTFEAPEGVVVDSRLEYLLNDCSAKPQPTEALGKLVSPMFRALVPSGVRTVHPGVDLGIQPVRVNVGVYNDGSTEATAEIQLRRSGCSGLSPSAKVISIAPRSFVQTSIFDLPSRCSNDPDVALSAAYVTVTVDQPSLSYAVALSDRAPDVTVGFAGQGQ